MIDGFATSELDEIEQAYYAFNFYPDLMTVLEMEAYHHLLATCELTRLELPRSACGQAGSRDPAVPISGQRRMGGIQVEDRKKDTERPSRPTCVELLFSTR